MNTYYNLDLEQNKAQHLGEHKDFFEADDHLARSDHVGFEWVLDRDCLIELRDNLIEILA